MAISGICLDKEAAEELAVWLERAALAESIWTACFLWGLTSRLSDKRLSFIPRHPCPKSLENMSFHSQRSELPGEKGVAF